MVKILYYGLFYALNINPFVPNAPFLYPLKTSENRKIFWCIQGIEKECLEKKWVNQENQSFYECTNSFIYFIEVLNSIESTNDTTDDDPYITANDSSNPKVCEKVYLTFYYIFLYFLKCNNLVQPGAVYRHVQIKYIGQAKVCMPRVGIKNKWSILEFSVRIFISIIIMNI